MDIKINWCLFWWCTNPTKVFIIIIIIQKSTILPYSIIKLNKNSYMLNQEKALKMYVINNMFNITIN